MLFEPEDSTQSTIAVKPSNQAWGRCRNPKKLDANRVMAIKGQYLSDDDIHSN